MRFPRIEHPQKAEGSLLFRRISPPLKGLKSKLTLLLKCKCAGPSVSQFFILKINGQNSSEGTSIHGVSAWSLSSPTVLL